ncbi:WD40/YVTN repeat-like-containing domain and WD40-repeat-containing domain-containing protein [Strongyloides ratti]|uniref:WD40/YVTN repeat-like-containing domain and WD40-repeat-containing domain-containing protein n=1 Tax=Strongyloides ratti TaxID=34506 RepID=A0A090L6R5_STRRB|nr:WD40/YVTN repeat-like-containing domain and WD40-repeat-containing domain-containing protein [Strongyloides ratti]CEF63174.1 WD40/YVTN repeat-like-containing domain and WD40-repeat-containing domain-containing protein [Strongyloides ratti]
MFADSFNNNFKDCDWEIISYEHNSKIKPLLVKIENSKENDEKICFIDENKNFIVMSNNLEILEITLLLFPNISSESITFIKDINIFDNVNKIIAIVNKTLKVLLLDISNRTWEFITFPSTIYSCLLVQDKVYNRFVLLAGGNNIIYLYDIPSKRILSKYIASNSELWDLRRNNEPLRIFKSLTPPMISSKNSLDVDKFSSTSIFLIQGSKDGSFKLSNIHNGTDIKKGKYKKMLNNMKSIKFLFKEQQFAVALFENSNELYVINLVTFEERMITTIPCQNKSNLHFLCVLPESKKLLFLENNRFIMIKFKINK